MTRRRKTQFCPKGHDTFMHGRDKHHRCHLCSIKQPEYRLTQHTKLAGRPQASICELCGQEGKTVWDHDHKSNLFRGWICNRCNLVLGAVKDDPTLLQKMIAYLGDKNEAFVC